MPERAFVIMQVGAKDSPERKRADEIYRYIIGPAVEAAALEPYRADQDLTPGPITPKFLTELLNARLIIADLTGRNPNVFYELGIAHAFARPLISIADSASSLPFDTKDERVIELGEYPSTGLTYAQGERVKAELRESLQIVLSDDYQPPSPLREVAANAAVDRLAPENPIAAEIAQMRATLDELREQLRGTYQENLRDELLRLLVFSRWAGHDSVSVFTDGHRWLRTLGDRETANVLSDRRALESNPSKAPYILLEPDLPPPGPFTLDGLRVSDLKLIAQGLDIKPAAWATKDDLIRAIDERLGARGPRPFDIRMARSRASWPTRP